MLIFQDRSDKKLRAAKKEQAEASLKVKERESRVKKEEKVLEEKVRGASRIRAVHAS